MAVPPAAAAPAALAGLLGRGESRISDVSAKSEPVAEPRSARFVFLAEDGPEAMPSFNDSDVASTDGSIASEPFFPHLQAHQEANATSASKAAPKMEPAIAPFSPEVRPECG